MRKIQANRFLSTAAFFLISLIPILSRGQNFQPCISEQYRSSSPTPSLTDPILQTRSGVIVIPVVIHVVYQNENENISEAQILSQLEVLNDDYRAQNDNQDIIPSNFQGLIADTEIEFCLASRTPGGQPTNGITRTMTSVNDIGLSNQVHYNAMGGRNAWNPNHYLNIWIADMGGSVAGRATFPGDAVLEEDGVVIDPYYFGTIGLAANSEPYHLGRSTVHEIGHYLNLEHVWGQGTPSCTKDDFVEDTPNSSENYLGQCPEGFQFSCNSTDMYTNYLYYTNDACMAQFSPGQKARMLDCLLSLRPGLMNSDGCEPVSTREQTLNQQLFDLSPNPARQDEDLSIRAGSSDQVRLDIYHSNGQLLFSTPLEPGEKISFPLFSLSSGLYLVYARTSQHYQVEKVIIH
jgi:hypothetical protein